MDEASCRVNFCCFAAGRLVAKPAHSAEFIMDTSVCDQRSILLPLRREILGST